MLLGTFLSNYLELGLVVQEHMLCKDTSIFSYGGHFIQQRGVVYILWLRTYEKTILCNYFEFGLGFFKDFSLFLTLHGCHFV